MPKEEEVIRVSTVLSTQDDMIDGITFNSLLFQNLVNAIQPKVMVKRENIQDGLGRNLEVVRLVVGAENDGNRTVHKVVEHVVIKIGKPLG